ncbi:MAG: acyl-CoA dehydrogenase family protein [Deltaproteobacteria bacterium]|nr:acyl-CoA dehydrogenase family protein [Deltaproteobacteria bacterium]MBW2383555.1 acyl-CoA dehydrogenase family protein [Deltaproteobacteria bacterium]
MDFQPSTEQKALQEGIRAFCEDRISLDVLPALAEAGGFDRVLWKELAELGVFSLRLAESQGGIGLGAADVVLVFEELGRRLAPGPIVWSELAAGLIEGAATGDCVVGGLDLVQVDVEPHMIEHLDALDALILLREDGLYRTTPDALQATPIDNPLDPLTPVHAVTSLSLSSLSSLSKAERIADAETAKRWRLDAMAQSAALALGIAEATLELALAYAKEREQFDRTIGSFQAIKHMLADMFTRQELARASVYAAGATLDHPEVGDVEQAVRGAKLIAGEAAMKNARACVQVHGGMGYTWEIPAHYYLKRCWVLENGFDAGHAHADWLADRLGAGATDGG